MLELTTTIQQANVRTIEWFLKGLKIIMTLAINSALKISKLNIGIQKERFKLFSISVQQINMHIIELFL